MLLKEAQKSFYKIGEETGLLMETEQKQALDGENG